MKQRVFALGFATLAAVSASSINIANAQTASARTATPATLRAQHHYFGTLVSANGMLLVIQLRNGRLLRVDAAQAFALNRVSAPFFRGKPTVVTGATGAGGVFYATAVTRAAPLSTAWGRDL
jgi:hypothetical protein